IWILSMKMKRISAIIASWCLPDSKWQTDETLMNITESILDVLWNILIINLSLLMQLPTSKTRRVEKVPASSSSRKETRDEQNKKRNRRPKKTLGS
ncbi:8649_t:CDS:2, partial [Gigaspora rosea]